MSKSNDFVPVMISKQFKQNLRRVASDEDLSMIEFTRRYPDILLNLKKKKEDTDEKKRYPFFKM